MHSGTRVSTQSTPVSTLRAMRFQTAHAQRNRCEHSEYSCEITQSTPVRTLYQMHFQCAIAQPNRVCTQSTFVSTLHSMRYRTAHAERNPCEYSEYPCEYTTFNAFPDRACTAEPE